MRCNYRKHVFQCLTQSFEMQRACFCMENGMKKNDGKSTGVLEREPDIEAVFEFCGVRKAPASDGYRPGHLIKEGYITSGVHHYYNQNSVPPDGTAAGTVTFITPEYYPHCLWEGKRLPIKEGARTVGYVKVTKVLNPLLKKQERK